LGIKTFLTIYLHIFHLDFLIFYIFPANCAQMLTTRQNRFLELLRQRIPDSDALRRFEELGPLLTGRGTATADDAVAWVASLVADLGIPRLSAFGMSGQMLPTVVERAIAASSTRTNPIVLSEGELTEILERAL